MIRDGLARAGQQIAEGKNVSTRSGRGLFPPLVIRMLRWAGPPADSRALLNVSYFYNRDVKDAIGKVEVMIEPAMTVILGALLGWVMLSCGADLRLHQQDQVLARCFEKSACSISPLTG